MIVSGPTLADPPEVSSVEVGRVSEIPTGERARLIKFTNVAVESDPGSWTGIPKTLVVTVPNVKFAVAAEVAPLIVDAVQRMPETSTKPPASTKLSVTEENASCSVSAT